MRRALFLIPLALACFESSQLTHAQCPQICDTNSNTALGIGAFVNNTTGLRNTAMGSEALATNTGGNENTAIGLDALFSNTTGSTNVAIGNETLSSNTTGFINIAIGLNSLTSNTTGWANTATGVATLTFNTTGQGNTANGNAALFSNTTGSQNTATGSSALVSNTIGIRNTANGLSALSNNTSGSQNTADGANALFHSTTSAANVAVGYNALFANTTGGSNTALGSGAGSKLTTGSNNIDIANIGLAGETGTIRMGTQGTQVATYIAGISGATVPTGVPVIVDTTGHLGTVVSSVRFKDAIKPMDKASESILALKPVTFRYKHDIDAKGTPQFGLVAEQVEKVNPDLVARDEQGKPYTVRYEAVNAMLLNEFLKEHKIVQQQDARLTKQEAFIANQQKQIEALTAGLQKVSAQLELSKTAPQTVSR
jgi:hypothetical protein